MEFLPGISRAGCHFSLRGEPCWTPELFVLRLGPGRGSVRAVESSPRARVWADAPKGSSSSAGG